MEEVISEEQERYISLNKARRMLDVSFERITWLIAIQKLSSKVDQQDRSKKLVSLQDVCRLHNISPQLLAPWLIYSLVDPRDNFVRYIGRTNEPQKRFTQHLNCLYIDNPAKYLWIKDLKKHSLLPRMEILEGVKGTLRDAIIRENSWIVYFKSINAEILNLPDITQRRMDYNSRSF
jgi:hypothetical protein